MALLDSIARWFGLSQRVAAEGAGVASAGDDRSVSSDASPDAPDGLDASRASYSGGSASAAETFDDIDADVIEPDGEAIRSAAPEPRPIVVPKSRAELIEELKKNYSEVLTLVRKVDSHLDDQRSRADRMLDIAETSSRKLDALPELTEQTGRVADAIVELVELTKKGQFEDKNRAEKLARTAIQQLEAAQQQTSVLGNVSTAVRDSGEANKELSTSVVEMASATSELSTKIETMREDDAARVEEFTKHLRTNQRGLILMVVLTGALAVGTLLAVVFGLGGA